MSISQNYFDRAKISYNLSIKFILDGDLKNFEETSIREIFHAYELLMKAHISKEHSLLLYDTKNLFKNKKLIPIDSLFAKPANELVEILAYLKAGNAAFDFLFRDRAIIEKMREERNILEHSSKTITDGFKGLILAPFVTKILKPLFIEFDPAMSDEFAADKMKEIFKEISDFSELVPDKNKYSFVERYYCENCNSRFSFLAKNKEELYCAVCEDTMLTSDEISPVTCFRCENPALLVDGDSDFICPDCHGESDLYQCLSCDTELAAVNDENMIICLSCKRREQLTDCPLCKEPGLDAKDELFFCHCCENKIEETKGDIGDEGCKCQSRRFLYLKPESGEDEAFCLECRSTFYLWQCPECKDYFSGDPVKAPEEYGKDCCENCAPGLFEAYRVKD